MKVSKLFYIAAITIILLCFTKGSNIQAEEYTVPKDCKNVCVEYKTDCKNVCAEYKSNCRNVCAEYKSIPKRVVDHYETKCTRSPDPALPDICVDKPVYRTTYEDVCVRWEKDCKDVCVRWEKECK